MYVKLQEAEDAKVHVEKLKLPVELDEKVTVPVGVEGDVEVSVTVTTQVVEEPTITEPGEQDNEVAVAFIVDEYELRIIPIDAETRRTIANPRQGKTHEPNLIRKVYTLN